MHLHSWLWYVAHGLACHSGSFKMLVAALYSSQRHFWKVIHDVPPVQLGCVAKVKELLVLSARPSTLGCRLAIYRTSPLGSGSTGVWPDGASNVDRVTRFVWQGFRKSSISDVSA